MTRPLPFDADRIARDDVLLDALGQGEPPPSDDEVAAMLAAWRDDLAADPPVVRRPAPRGATAGAGAVVTGGPGAVVTGGAVELPRVRHRRFSRAILAAAAAAITVAGTLALASMAEPDSPLWPITKIVFDDRDDRADSRTAQREAERRIALAREAATQQRYGEADRLLDEATALVEQVRDRTVAERLLEEIAEIRLLLPADLSPDGLPSGQSGVLPTPGPSSSPPDGSSPSPSPAGGLLPPLPDLPLPLPSLPLPSLPLPSLPVPGLPLSIG